jgi:apolipoprotein N-acyltransferase
VQRRSAAGGLAAAAVVVPSVLGGAIGPHAATSTIDVALVQGGGPRGFRAVDTSSIDVYERHVEASERLRPGPDIVLWPEDVIDIEGAINDDPLGVEMALLARRLRATVIAGVVEGEGSDNFRNAAVAWDRTGGIADRYEKVRRVPFGEYVPMRGLVRHLADLSAVPRDALKGEGPGLLLTRNVEVGVLISYEVFFADRGRAAVRAGADMIVVPTNAASFKTTQVPTQQVAAARLRAIETGRDVVQAGPTGYGAFVGADGKVRHRTVLSEQTVAERPVRLRQGRTMYVRTGDSPLLLAVVAALGGAWATVAVGRREEADPPPA